MALQGEYIYEWPRPMVTADALIFAVCNGRKSVLLIRRGNDPFKGLWAIPGGFLEMDEEIETAANRELLEETGIEGIELKQMHTFGTPGRDPRGRQITVVFTATVEKEIKPTAGDDAAEAKWFDIEDLPELAFDHDKVIAMGIENL
jgi:8-oxo-dGTP diphosphatase